MKRERITEKKQGKLMSVRQMGNLLGLKKTGSYWLLHKNLFKTKTVNGKMWVDIESFEEWYANQAEYHKSSGEEPGRKLGEWSYSIKEISEKLGISEAGVYALVKEGAFEETIVNSRKRVLRSSFDEWYAQQARFHPENTEPCSEKEEAKNPSGKQQRRFITLKEAASIAGITRQAVSKHMEKNEFAYIRKRRLIRINRESFYAWLYT